MRHNGKRPEPRTASPLPLPPNAAWWREDHEPTDFQRAVLDAVATLRRGDLVTYGDLVTEAGHPGGAQAVANVLRRVPGLPWWRVVPADGRLYRSHASWQGPLLEAEGHHVDADRRVSTPERSEERTSDGR
jgi:methylated-DNA-protein-cysteine methyltransferase related protein